MSRSGSVKSCTTSPSAPRSRQNANSAVATSYEARTSKGGRVVRGVEEALHRPVGLGPRVEGSQQPVPVVQGRVLPQKVLVLVLRLRERSPEPESHAFGISPLSSLKPSATITTAGSTFPIFLCPRTADGSRTGPARTVRSAAPSC